MNIWDIWKIIQNAIQIVASILALNNLHPKYLFI